MKLFSKNRIGNRIFINFLGFKIKIKAKDSDTLLADFLKQWETDYDAGKLERDLKAVLQAEPAFHNRELYLILTATLIENNKEQEAADLLKTYLKRFPKEDLYAYVPVCLLAQKTGISDLRIRKTAEIFAVLEQNRSNGSLENLLAGKSIAVVGNSPNLMGKNLGKDIDSHDYVVRFNNFKTKGFEADYGTRTDIWVCCQANDVVNRPEEEIRKMAYLLYNVDFLHTKLRFACFENICKNLEYGVPVSYIGALYKRELKSAGVVYPSSGLSSLYHLHRMFGLKRKNIYGFSFLEGSTNYYDHYFAAVRKRKVKKFVRNCHHNFEAESVFLNHLFSEAA